MPVKYDRSLLPARPSLSFELDLWAKNSLLVAGVDEAGRGAWAGPVYAAAVILPAAPEIASLLSAVRDSKQLTARQRQSCALIVRQTALAWAVGKADAGEIDDIGILPATRLAMMRAIAGLTMIPDHLLIDYVVLPELPYPQTSLVKGDARSLSIASASNLAKTTRDAEMVSLDLQFPGYGFARHKGYGTARHRDQLARLGPSSIHRKSFQPICLMA